jgi:hypothetical protein
VEIGATVSGTVRSLTGSQNEMASWVVVMLQKDQGQALVDEIGPIGNYEIRGVSIDLPHTMVLLDPQYRFSAILTYPGSAAGTVYQYFTLTSAEIPTLVHNGPVLSFTVTDNISWDSHEAVDTDSDLIPDGQEVALRGWGLADTDGDGVDNADDPDIDNDGIPNWFDSDDDGDGVADVFDTDANGDETPDLAQNVGDIHFNENLSYIMVQVTQDVQADSSLDTQLLLTAKTHETFQGQGIRVRGPDFLFDEAVAASVSTDTGETVTSAWDQTLLDDGLNEDGGAGDGIYGRKIVLASGIAPKAKQVVFFQVARGEGDNVTYDEFPYMFPNLTTGVVTGSYDSAERIVTKSGSPFGSTTEYQWSVHIFDANGVKVFSSEPLVGSESTYTIPAGTLDTSQSYTAKIIANSLARIPSYPSWIIRSQSFDLL